MDGSPSPTLVLALAEGNAPRQCQGTSQPTHGGLGPEEGASTDLPQDLPPSVKCQVSESVSRACGVFQVVNGNCRATCGLGGGVVGGRELDLALCCTRGAAAATTAGASTAEMGEPPPAPAPAAESVRVSMTTAAAAAVGSRCKTVTAGRVSDSVTSCWLAIPFVDWPGASLSPNCGCAVSWATAGTQAGWHG